ARSSASHKALLRILVRPPLCYVNFCLSLSPGACDRARLPILGSQSFRRFLMGYRVAVVGATGNVGREILNILAERQFPVDEVAAVASARSTGDLIDFGDSGEELKVKNLEHFDFAGWDIALFAAGSEVSKVHAPRAANA